MMRPWLEGARSTRAVVAQAGATAVAGLIAIRLADGPTSALIVQAGAVVFGALIAIGLALNPWRPGPKGAATVIGAALALLFATLGDTGADVHRWIVAGPVMLQPASIVLPFVIWALAVARTNWWAGTLTGAFALVLAIQPDAASATALLLALVGLAVVRGRVAAPDVTAMLMALAATVWAWTRLDSLPAVAHVERVVPEAFAVNPVAGIAAGLMLALLPLPFLFRAVGGAPDRRAVAVGLAGLWIGQVAGNLFGNYPAPVIGYGASLVVGWLASIGLCLSRARPAPTPRWTIVSRAR
jgi:hypothetical protein